MKETYTDPLNADTDGDGFMDGDDLFPKYNASVKVSIKYFEDTSAPGEGPDTGWISTPGDPYFKIWVGSTQQDSNHPIARDITSMYNPYSASFDIPDNIQFVSVKVEVWDEDSFDFDDQYDCSSDPDSTFYQRLFDVLGGTATETSDGVADGSLQGAQAKIIVEIWAMPQ